MGTGVSFAGGNSAVHPVSRSRERGAIPPLPPHTGTTLYGFLISFCNVILYKVLRDYESTYSLDYDITLSSVIAIENVA